MFNKNKDVAEAQKIMLEILVEVHRVCVKNNRHWSKFVGRAVT